MFRTANLIEAAFWIAVGAAFLIVALRRRQGRASAASAAVVFIAFGVSDIVETTTGAWWRPWWLLVWKGVCVLALLTLFVRWRRPAAG
ncbi:MAG TPA: hypothetical protein P5572_08340 [Phycisphaerae bacterium]|nr:hypothetical protein [Phycisphaerales bacterium]HRX85012.1 hypothetical protein [Phycisphaerae bacterium]